MSKLLENKQKSAIICATYIAKAIVEGGKNVQRKDFFR